MATFNNVPFNFVPLNHDVFIPEWGDEISQDIPFEDGEDGVIRFTITNTTPLFIKNDTNKDKSDSAYVEDANGNRHYYIPATSIKGMLRSVFEVLSFSKMQKYDDDFFGYRNFDTKLTDGKEYVNKMQNVECGWLKKELDNNGNDIYILQDCGEFEKVAINDLPNYYSEVRTETAIKKAKTFNGQGLGSYPMVRSKRLVCTGYMHNKKNEYLFPLPTDGTTVSVDNEVASAFISVYKPSPYYDHIKDTLNEGSYLPVFFKKNGKGKVVAIGMTRMFRFPYVHKVSDGIKQTTKNSEGTLLAEGHDLTECVFGYTNKKDSLRGRVQIGNAFSENEINNTICVRGVLGQPNASYYPYYLKQSNSPYTTFSSEKIEIAGRKRYRVHSDSNIPSELPQGNGNESVMATLRLLPNGNRFACEIRVHNLRAVELGALLSSITFHGNDKCHHNIGMAKAFGYGRLQISDVQLSFLSHDKEYYMKEFEKQMSLFLKKATNTRWSDSDQIISLMSIASDHTDEMGYMDFEGYKQGKRNNKFKVLSENPCQAHSMLTNIEYRKLPFMSKYEEIQRCLDQNEYDKVKQLCDELEQLLSPEHDEMIDDYRREVNSRLAQREEEILRKAAEEANAAREARIGAGLLAFLDEKFPNKDEYKVKDFKVAISKVSKWMKDKQETTLDNDEIQDLTTSLKRIYTSIKPKEKKDWDNSESKWWKELGKLIGNDEAEKMFNSIIG